MLRAAVCRSGGVIGVDKIDTMADDLMHGAAKLAQRRIDVRAQLLAAEAIPPHLNVRHEQRHPAIEISGVDGHRIADRELPDRQA